MKKRKKKGRKKVSMRKIKKGTSKRAITQTLWLKRT